MTEPIGQTNMQYVRLGTSGLRISKLILGCMSYGTPKWQDWVLEEEEGIRHIKASYDLGINAFDTSNNYSNGLSEVVLGKAIKQHNLPREEIVVMTKVFGALNRTAEGPPLFFLSKDELDKQRYVNQRGLSRKHIFDSVRRSLERLQLDYIDVYQCHRFDHDTPIEETMQALHDVVKAGYVRYIGMSSCYAWQLHKMQNYAKTHGLTQFISMQNFHCAVYREEEREMVPLLQDLGVGMIPWSSLAGGLLARPIDETTTRKTSEAFFSKNFNPSTDPSLVATNTKIAEIAKTHTCSMAQVAMAWELSKPFVTAPIIGTTNLDKLHDLIGCLALKLSPEELAAIDELYIPKGIIGHA